ncbi:MULTISPECIES: sorbosone dehydrogenase family protein [Shewanella]|uniref:PQQ-dependent sugar dehydrogenase n=1 Tax=Shewanella TaxID=22 RepID=UPI000C4317F0|nr:MULTISPECIES: sorbosone dehydrogenase family protein [Shewanella]NCQ46106.1 sorbosone dehydrogenase family protein [Shewanella frigidimarina]NCO70564.1 sorbosone dehydrogenase family protein [Shewanella vesiculosa]NCP36364.1 sorbosone dehydrogenase family protein [Shewanella vesiculosa]NCP69645.1 sorbosone dehydrogenase family protein [Shewanella vesiculosa]NCP74972.1 sorbosone dehydrogenase family protein [Shewanella vesiculosa]
MIKPITLLTALTLGMSLSCPSQALPLDRIQLPQGFSIDIYAENIENARQMALGDNGTVFVGSRKAGNVYALIDTNHDFKADKKIIVATDLFMPSGIAFHQGSLYVAEVDKIWRYPDIEKSLPTIPKAELVFDKLPNKSHHGWKFIAFGPDGKLYVPVGAPCNVCESELPFASILKLDPDSQLTDNQLTGSQQTQTQKAGSTQQDSMQTTIVAQGVRNSVGFDFHPVTGELWFTDNGRDMMGDDLPDDELNRVSQTGQHFGFPYVHNNNIADPEFTNPEIAKLNTPPALTLGAHVAALGMEFYQGQQFPAEYKNTILIAQHGSWNRSNKVGYRIMKVVLNGNTVSDYSPFATGWLNGEQSWGRPVDVMTLADGSILVSDDFANAVYRISYTK